MFVMHMQIGNRHFLPRRSMELSTLASKVCYLKDYESHAARVINICLHNMGRCNEIGSHYKSCRWTHERTILCKASMDFSVAFIGQ